MKFPSIEQIARELRLWNLSTERLFWVYLVVWGDGEWSVRNDPGYDQDHHGYWGSDVMPGRGKRFNSTAMAQDLLNQVEDDYYSSW